MNPPQTMSSLMVCPFCGTQPEDEYANGCRYIYCLNEKCEVRPHVNTGPDAMERRGLKRDDYEKWTAEQWNTRHIASPTISEEVLRHLSRIHSAAFELTTFGRPKEGSDKYKAAWDALWATMTPGPYPSLEAALEAAGLGGEKKQ